MNISIISPQIYPCITGGVEIFNYHLTKELAKRGHNVWVLTNCEHNLCNRNISVVKLNKGFSINPTVLTNFHIFLKLLKFRRQVDVAYVPYVSNSPLVYLMLLAKKLFDISYIISIHGGGMYQWRPKAPHKLFFKNADAIVAVSETIKKEYEKRSGRKIKVIPPLIPFRESKIPKNELRNRYRFSDNDTIILYLGSIKRIKGSDILLDAFLNLGKEYIGKNKLRLLYVGDGPMKTTLEEKVYEKDFSEYVKFIGSIPHEKVPQMYKLADIYIIPSFFEGTPISLLEAMFNGLPIIGSNTVGINSLIKHGEEGLLFDKGSMKDLEDKIKKVVENMELANLLGKNAKRRFFKDYSFDNMVLEYIKIMKNVCGE